MDAKPWFCMQPCLEPPTLKPGCREELPMERQTPLVAARVGVEEDEAEEAEVLTVRVREEKVVEELMGIVVLGHTAAGAEEDAILKEM